MPQSEGLTDAQARGVQDLGPSSTPTLHERLTDELVLAVTGPVGAGCTTVIKRMEEILKNAFHYETHYIRLSRLIESACDLNDYREIVNDSGLNTSPEFSRIRLYQVAGNNIRKTHSSDYLARLVVQQIHLKRRASEKLVNESTKGLENPVPVPWRIVHLIDSIKNPAELELLKQVYGDAFWCVGVLCPYDVRKERLSEIGLSASEIEIVMEIDENEREPYGQKVRETISSSDFFVRNDKDKISELDPVLRRFIDLLFSTGIHTPTFQEKGMAVASSAASASACLSRQVGAAVYSKWGELIGIGANDVPRFGGGLYTCEDQSFDNRCAFWKQRVCHNDAQKEDITRALMRSLWPLLKDGISESQVREKILESRISGLVEFSRSVHAEMEAIVSVARGGKQGIVGGTMFTTTFPCHNCARHIVASGIKSVYYIEAYPKSLALQLHKDSISVDQGDEGQKCVFLQFEGVAPRKMLKLFSASRERKREGRLWSRAPSEVHPVAETPLDGFAVREQLVVGALGETEDEHNGAQERGGGSRPAVDLTVADQQGDRKG